MSAIETCRYVQRDSLPGRQPTGNHAPHALGPFALAHRGLSQGVVRSKGRSTHDMGSCPRPSERGAWPQPRMPKAEAEPTGAKPGLLAPDHASPTHAGGT